MTENIPDLDAIEVDAEQRLSELREQHQRAAPEALTDPKVAAEVADIESQIAAAQAVIHRVKIARTEQDHRAREAASQAAAEARAKAAREARKLDGKLAEVARRFDEAADALASSMAEHRKLAERRAKLLHAAGLTRDPWAPMGAYQVALLAGLDRHDCASWLDLRFGGQPVSLERQCAS
jgi:hypothetical protein